MKVSSAPLLTIEMTLKNDCMKWLDNMIVGKKTEFIIIVVKMTVDILTIDKMAVFIMTDDKIVVDKMTVDKITWCQIMDLSYAYLNHYNPDIAFFAFYKKLVLYKLN